MPHDTPTNEDEFNPQELRQLARDWFEAFNARDLERLVGLHTEDAQHYSPKLAAKHPETRGIIRGREALRQWWQDAFNTIEGLRYDIKHITAQTNRVIVEYTRLANGDQKMSVAEAYEVTRVSGALRIKLSMVYHG